MSALVFLVECVAAVLIIGGAGFILIGSIGLARLPDVFSRLHGPTKATTLGIGGLLLGSVLHSAASGQVSVHELLVVAFLFLTAPVGAHLIARAALHAKRRQAADGRPAETGASVEVRGAADGQ